VGGSIVYKGEYERKIQDYYYSLSSEFSIPCRFRSCRVENVKIIERRKTMDKEGHQADGRCSSVG
jgi:hypothetical protein